MGFANSTVIREVVLVADQTLVVVLPVYWVHAAGSSVRQEVVILSLALLEHLGSVCSLDQDLFANEVNRNYINDGVFVACHVL